MSRHGVHRDGYKRDADKQREYSAASKARRISAHADIGDIPELNAEQAQRKARCVGSLREFAETYCSQLLEHEPSAKLCDYADTLQAAIEGAGQVHVRMARGAGKTTWVKIALAWGLATGRLHYAVVFCASAELSAAVVSDVWDILEFSDKFLEDFPEVAYPIVKAGGIVQRYATQHIHGKPTRMKHSAREIVLPTVEGFSTSAGVLIGRGAGSKTRGLVRGKRRPDLVLLDDLQSREDAQNPERARKLSAWIDGDVQGLAGSRLLNAVMTSTPIVAGDLSEQYADAEQHPGWKLVEYRLLDGEPSHPELWEEYGERWKRARQTGDMGFREATAFYAAHRAEMDAGLDVLDPGKFDARLELSGIQHAWNQRLTMGETAFRAEYQLEPIRENVALELEARDVQRALNGSPRGVLPPGTLAPVAFVDVMGDQLHYTVAAFGPRQTAAVIDYGRFPDKGRATPRNAPERDVEAALARALLTLAGRLYSTPYRRADGRETRLHALWMDCGWQQATVHRVAALLRNRGHANTWGCRGYASTGYAISSRYIVIPGDLVDMRERDGQRWAAQNSDAFREATQRAFLGVPLAPGSLSVWGRDPAEHADFAAHVTAERLTDKAVSERGVTLYRWALRPGALNHWLDSTSGCVAMAAFYRFWTAEDVPREAARAIGATVPARTARARRPRIYSARKTSR